MVASRKASRKKKITVGDVGQSVAESQVVATSRSQSDDRLMIWVLCWKDPVTTMKMNAKFVTIHA